MNKGLTGDDVLAVRVYLKLTQVQLSVAVGMVGVTTINRWENGHTSPSPAWATLVETYFVSELGKNWRTKVRTPRFELFKKLKTYIDKNDLRLQLNPASTVAELAVQYEDAKLVAAEHRKLKKKKELAALKRAEKRKAKAGKS